MSQRKWTRPSDYDRAAFHRWLVEASAVRGLSRTKLADLSGIPRTTLNEALRDERLLTAAVRAKLIGTLTNDGQEPVVIDRHDLWLISGIDRGPSADSSLFLECVENLIAVCASGTNITTVVRHGGGIQGAASPEVPGTSLSGFPSASSPQLFCGNPSRLQGGNLCTFAE